MKLLEIKVKNFRSINGDNVKITFEKSDVIFLIGQNNSSAASG